MRVSFQADNDFSQTIRAALLRLEPMMDFQTAAKVNLYGLSDLSVLSLAASENRVLVSHDQSTMPVYFAQFISENTSSGLLIVPHSLPLNVAARELLTVWAASGAEEWINRIAYIPL